MKQAVDFGALDTRKAANEGIELQLVHERTRQPIEGFVLRIRGYDSDAYQEKAEEQQRKRLERGRGGRVPTVEELKADALALATTLVISWPEGATVNGKAASAVLLMEVPDIREQVEAAAGRRANFFQGSSAA